MKLPIRASCIIALLITAVLLLTVVSPTESWYQPSFTTATGEKTSDFLPSDTTVYFSFNLQSGYAQSTQLDYFLSFYKEAILAKIRNVSSFAASYINDNDWASIFGPELALATYNVSGNSGIVFFVQVPSGQYSEDIQELVIYAMDTILGGKQSEGPVGGGVTQITRTVGGVLKTEYYTNATAGGSSDRYVLGSIGNITLADFQLLNASVTAGTWAGDSLSLNAGFIDVKAELPSARMGLGFVNGVDLQDSLNDLCDAIDPYLAKLETIIPAFSMVDAGLSIMRSSLIAPYVPPYAGISVSGTYDSLKANFYSPDDNFPFASGISNLLSTAGFIPSDVQLYCTDVDANAWWQILQPNASELADLANELSSAGMSNYMGFDISLLADLVQNPSLDANVFNWSTGEFAAAHLPYAGGTGYLLVFSVSDYDQALAKIGNLTAALTGIGASGVHSRFTPGNTYIIVGWPAGIIDDMLSKPRLSTNTSFNQIKNLLLSSRGLMYKDAGAPLLDMGISYYMGSVKGGVVFRVPPPGGGGGGGGGGSGGSGVIPVPVPPFVPSEPTQLFDITLTIDSAVLQKSSDLTARLRFESFGTVPTPVDLTFIVLDESGQEVYKAVIANEIVVETELSYSKRFYDLDVPAGNYVLVARTLYNVDVSDEFLQDFSVIPTPVPSGGLSVGAWAGIGIAIVIALALLIYLVLLKMYPPVKRESEKP
ncbi:MAG: hypothetical protein WC333_07055 [Dehalococcoidia bacterium]